MNIGTRAKNKLVQSVTFIGIVLSVYGLVDSVNKYAGLEARYEVLSEMSFESNLAEEILEEEISDLDRRNIVKEEIEAIDKSRESLRSIVLQIWDGWRKDSLFNVLIFGLLLIGFLFQLFIVRSIKLSDREG